MRVQHQITLAVSDDAAGLLGEFSRSQNVPATVLDGFTASASGTFFLPATGEPRMLAMGDLTAAAGLYLEADGALLLTLDGRAPLTLTPGAAGAQAKFFLEGACQAVRLAALAPRVAVRGRYTAWGHAPPVGP